MPTWLTILLCAGTIIVSFFLVANHCWGCFNPTIRKSLINHRFKWFASYEENSQFSICFKFWESDLYAKIPLLVQLQSFLLSRRANETWRFWRNPSPMSMNLIHTNGANIRFFKRVAGKFVKLYRKPSGAGSRRNSVKLDISSGIAVFPNFRIAKFSV